MPLRDTPDAVLLQRVIELVQRARAHGVAVSPSKTTDLLRALGLVDATNRSALQRVVRLTLGGRIQDGPVLIALVDELFPKLAPVESNPPTLDTLRDMLTDAVAAGDADAAGRLGMHASELLDADDGRLWSLNRASQRALRAVELSQVLRRAMSQSNEFDRVAAEGRQRALTAFEAELKNGLRPNYREEDTPDELLDADLIGLSESDKAALQASVRSLAKKIATRLRAERHSPIGGRFDPRQTQRKALATGGVPINPVQRTKRKRPRKLTMLCDVSGSMADYTRFTLAFVTELVDHLASVRAHVFVDGSGDVTHLLTRSQSLIDMQTLLMQPGVIVGDGHTDYAQAFRSFRDGSDLDSRSSLLIIGDARTRGLDAAADVLHDLTQRCRTTHWLNPDPEDQWDNAHSSARTYEAVCDQMVEVRTIRQLADWISTTL